MGADTAPLFPTFGPAAECFLVQYQEYIATGAWARLVFNCAEAMSASTSPVPIAPVNRAASAQPMH
jgi:hypothetical protein